MGGFAAGVMLAASFWSLLAPAIEIAESSGMYGESGEHAYAPVAVGFFLGAMFVYLTDVLMTYFKIGSSDIILAMESSSRKKPGHRDRHPELPRRTGRQSASSWNGHVLVEEFLVRAAERDGRARGGARRSRGSVVDRTGSSLRPGLRSRCHDLRRL